MALSSLMVPLGTPAPNFTLDDLSGTKVRLDDFAAAPALLVAFLCNHCPYVRHIEAELGRVIARYPNLAAVGMCTNDSETYPDDRPERLADQARRASWTFPYLLDTEQTVGRAFAAACTPDFFLYDAPRRLAYRGAFDESTPGNGKPVTGALLSDAISHVLAGEPVPEPHRPSMGCSIKWRPSGFDVTLQVTPADAKPRSRPEEVLNSTPRKLSSWPKPPSSKPDQLTTASTASMPKMASATIAAAPAMPARSPSLVRAITR